MSKKTITIIALLLFAACITIFGSANASTLEIDKTGVVEIVHDGDTFRLTTGETIRLADIDTPEKYENRYVEAKNFVTDLIEGEKVYLDIDDETGTDQYGRLICVVYYDYNSTKYGNLNKALLENDLAIINNYQNNEFNPDTWTITVDKLNMPTPTLTQNPSTPTTTQNTNSAIPETTWLLIESIAAVIVIIIILLVVIKKKKNPDTSNQPHQR